MQPAEFKVPSGLMKIASQLEALDKTAAGAPALPLSRAAGYGALAGLGLHAGNKLLSVSTGVPMDPTETAVGSAGKAAAGGVAIAGLLNLLNRITARR